MDDINATIEAIWVVDSETGDEILLDLKTSKELSRRSKDAK